MAIVCGVIECKHRSTRDKIRYFKLPKISALPSKTAITAQRHNAWVKALNRGTLISKYIFVCSDHFISGRIYMSIYIIFIKLIKVVC